MHEQVQSLEVRVRDLETGDASLNGSLRTIKTLLLASLASGLISAGWFASTTISSSVRIEQLEAAQAQDRSDRQQLAQDVGAIRSRLSEIGAGVVELRRAQERTDVDFRRQVSELEARVERTLR